MTIVLLVLQFIIIITMIACILLQKTGADSLSGLSGSGGSIFSARSANTFLYKVTIFLAVCFFVNSIAIAKVINNEYSNRTSILKNMEQVKPEHAPIPKVAE